MLEAYLKLFHVLEYLVSIFGAHIQVVLWFLLETLAYTVHLFSISLGASSRKLWPLADELFLFLKLVVYVFGMDLNHSLNNLLAIIVCWFVNFDKFGVALYGSL